MARVWQTTPVFLPGESHGRGEPGWLQSMGLQEAGHDWTTKEQNTAFFFKLKYTADVGFAGGSAGKGSAWNVRDLGLIPGLGISPEERKGYPL